MDVFQYIENCKYSRFWKALNNFILTILRYICRYISNLYFPFSRNRANDNYITWKLIVLPK